MSEAAVKRMTVAEFLRWEDGTDTRYELLGGSPVAMAPPAAAHGSSRYGFVPGSELRSNLAARVWCRSRRESPGRTGTTRVTSQISR